MVVFAIVLLGITLLIAPQATRGAQPIVQIRASELAQSLFSEIQAKAFDERSSLNGGLVRCGEAGVSCTPANALGFETGETRSNFDDVDDYHNFRACDNHILDTALGTPPDLYQGFCVTILVEYDSSLTGVNGNSKRINIRVTTPANQAINFASYRMNY